MMQLTPGKTYILTREESIDILGDAIEEDDYFYFLNDEFVLAIKIDCTGSIISYSWVDDRMNIETANKAILKFGESENFEDCYFSHNIIVDYDYSLV